MLQVIGPVYGVRGGILFAVRRPDHEGVHLRWLFDLLEAVYQAADRRVCAARFHCAIVAGLLKNIANQHTLNRDTVTKIRSILSGIFTYAMSEGHFPGRNALENPASRARIPESAVEPVEPKAAAAG
jgi:hypothetical protein